MSRFRHSLHEVPGLNTSSLPDLIFSVLFFFMIVTHMRDVQLKVKYKVPQGTELVKLTKKSTVSYIYIGKPLGLYSDGRADSTYIQLNDKFADISDIPDYISAERSLMSPEDIKKMTVSIKADKNTEMGILIDLKKVLRDSYALKISYSAIDKK